MATRETAPSTPNSSTSGFPSQALWGNSYISQSSSSAFTFTSKAASPGPNLPVYQVQHGAALIFPPACQSLDHYLQ